MDIKQIITATVAVILICLVAIPLIQTSSEGIYSTTNNTTEMFLMTSAKDTESVTLEFATGSYKVNGEEVPTVGNTTYRIKAFWPGGMLKAPSTAVIQFNEDGNSSVKNVTKLVYDPEKRTITYTVASGDTVIENVPYIYYMSNNGDYGLFRTLEVCNISKNTDYFVFCDDTFRSGFGSYKSGYIYKNGEVVDTILDPKFAPNQNDYTAATISFDLNIVDVDSQHFTVGPQTTVSVNDTTLDNTFISVIAPIEYKYVSDNDSIVITILDLIPILLIAAVLIGIGYSLMRRD